MVCPECREPVEFVNGDNDMDIEEALEELKQEFEMLMAMEETETKGPQAEWPFAPTTQEKQVTEEKKSKWWTVKTYHKKSCEQHEYFVQRDGPGRITVTDGFRWCEYNVETNDGEFPRFEFTNVPGGNSHKDSLDMNSLTEIGRAHV